jgi:hypothetical protein
MLIGAYSTPTNTSPARRPRRFGQVYNVKHFRRLATGLDPHCTHPVGSFTESVAAEIDEVAAGKRASSLLQPAAGRETA